MSAIFGVLGVVDGQADFVANVGQALIFDAVNEVLGRHNADVAAATGLFVKGETELFQERWLAPGTGTLTPVGQDPLAPGPAVGRYGEWDVAYPLREYSESFSASRAGLAYMTLGELDAHLDTIMERDMAQHRLRMLIALFESTNLTWVDIIHGSLTIRRLANTDGSLYPVLPGASAEAQDTHYIDAAYDVAGIANATTPTVDLRDEIIEHFGGRHSGGENILYLHGDDQTAKLAALTDYDSVPDFGKLYGADTDLSKMLAGVPGRLHGRSDGVWCSEWAWIPDEFGMAVHLDYPPLVRRVDTSISGLPRGLSLVARDQDHPLESAFYSDRFGYAVRNRLSAACIEINAGGATYSPPAAYAE